MKKLIYILIALLIVSTTACSNKDNKPKETTPETSVKKENLTSMDILTTDKFVYNMVEEIVGSRHDVDYMFSSKDKIWTYEYTDDSLNNISKMDLFIYSGAGFEPWMDDFLDKLSKSKVSIINTSRGIKLVSYDKEVKYKDTVLKDNPYYWMNIDNYKIALSNIKNGIEDRDTKSRDYYEDNFSKTIKELEDYQKRLKEVSDKVKDYTFVVDGDELDYFTKYCDFKTLKLYNYGVILTPEITAQNNKVENELKDAKNIIFLYDDAQKLKSNEALINKYNIKPVNIIVYKKDLKYNETLKQNVQNLESVVQNQR